MRVNSGIVVKFLLVFFLLTIITNVKSAAVDSKEDGKPCMKWNETEKKQRTEKNETTKNNQSTENNETVEITTMKIGTFQLINAPIICPEGTVLDANEKCIDQFN